MNFIKNLLIALALGLFLASCSTDNGANQNKEISKDTSLANNAKTMQMAKQTEKALDSLVTKLGYDDFFDNSFVHGNIDKDQFITTSSETGNALKLYYRLSALKIGYDVEFNSFEFINAKENNGYPMLISNGTCKLTGEHLSMGINLSIDENNMAKAVGGPGGGGTTTVTCTGCDVGCSPRRTVSGDGWCTNCVSSGGCVKTETLN